MDVIRRQSLEARATAFVLSAMSAWGDMVAKRVGASLAGDGALMERPKAVDLDEQREGCSSVSAAGDDAAAAAAVQPSATDVALSLYGGLLDDHPSSDESLWAPGEEVFPSLPPPAAAQVEGGTANGGSPSGLSDQETLGDGAWGRGAAGNIFDPEAPAPKRPRLLTPPAHLTGSLPDEELPGHAELLEPFLQAPPASTPPSHDWPIWTSPVIPAAADDDAHCPWPPPYLLDDADQLLPPLDFLF